MWREKRKERMKVAKKIEFLFVFFQCGVDDYIASFDCSFSFCIIAHQSILKRKRANLSDQYSTNMCFAD